MALQAEQGTRAGCPGAQKPAAAEVHLALAAAWASQGCRRVTPAAGIKPRTTPAQAAHGWTAEREQQGARLVLIEICFADRF